MKINSLLHNNWLDGLTTRVVGRTAYHYDSVGSTNDVARELAREGTPEGTVVFTEEQTAGRGRRGRQWVAPYGSSLLMSFVFYPQLCPHQAQRLTMACSLAAVEAIAQVAGLPAELKWPNDLLIHGRKVAGFLAESSITDGQLDFVVVGMGINVNFDRSLLRDVAPQGSTLASEAGHDIHRRFLLHTLLYQVEKWLPAIYGPDDLHKAWCAHLGTLGQEVLVINGQSTVQGVAESVDKDGALRVRDGQGRRHRFLAGDVTLRAKR